MKISIYTIVVALAAYAAADGLAAEPEEIDARDALGHPARCDKVAKRIPKCARGPITKCTKKQGCGARDYACGCKHKKPITKCATSPVIAACGTAGALKARKAAAALCKCVHKG